jgi:hypothetical protein
MSREVRYMALQAFFFVGLVLLILSGCGGSSPTGSPSSLLPGCSGAANIVACSTQSNLQIDVGNAPQMKVHDSQVIKVELREIHYAAINEIPPDASIPAEKSTVTIANTNPVGTPGTNLRDAFGSGYEVFATATLSPNPAFTFMPLGDTASEQPLTQNSVLWRWSVIANEPGTEILDVNIEAMWGSPTSGQLPPQKPVSIGNAQVSIQVTETLPTPTPTPNPTPTPMPTPTVTPTALPSHNSFDTLQFASNIAQVASLIYLVIFGGRAVYDVVESHKLRLPSAPILTNILLAAILVLISLFFLLPALRTLSGK